MVQGACLLTTVSLSLSLVSTPRSFYKNDSVSQWQILGSLYRRRETVGGIHRFRKEPLWVCHKIKDSSSATCLVSSKRQIRLYSHGLFVIIRCGTDSVVMYWDKVVLMIGPFGDWIKFSYDDPIFLSSEIDGVRITSNDKCELLQKVPGKMKAWGGVDWKKKLMFLPLVSS